LNLWFIIRIPSKKQASTAGTIPVHSIPEEGQFSGRGEDVAEIDERQHMLSQRQGYAPATHR